MTCYQWIYAGFLSAVMAFAAWETFKPVDKKKEWWRK